MPTDPANPAEAALTIQEMSRRSGLSEHTLRYYERIGLLSPVGRNDSSGHRRYDPDAVRVVETLACLSGAGMSIADMRTYLRLRPQGEAAAGGQQELFAAHAAVLDAGMERLKRQREYLAGKVAYWEAVKAGDTAGAEAIAEANALLARTLTGKKETR